MICIGHNGKDRCGYSIPRHDFQQILESFNQELREKADTFKAQSFRPDGDVEISNEDIKKFYLPQWWVLVKIKSFEGYIGCVKDLFMTRFGLGY